MEPLISIYGTVFNNANVIRKSIDSIISKLPDFKKRFEMVIVDNYSSDGTYEILKGYQKEYPNITVIQEKCKDYRIGINLYIFAYCSSRHFNIFVII